MRNPFDHPLIRDASKRDKVVALLKTMMQRTKKSWDESIIPDDDPDGIFTPLQLVANVLDPKIKGKFLSAILESGTRGATYRDAIANLEERLEGTYDIEEGVLPKSWLKSKGKIGDKELPSEFRDLFSNIGENVEEARRILDWGF